MPVRSSLTPRRSRLTVALFAALVLPAATAFAQEEQQTSASSAQSTATLDKVVVTGSRIKRTEIEGPAPVTVITAEDIERQGFTTVYDALNTLTQFTGSVQNELTTNGFTPNANVVNLRGLGPGRTLVLINGRRTAEYPLPYNSQSNFVNLATIPAAAVERIEVLSGGASAIYGSDAIAGVLNVITKKNFEGDELTLRAGTTSRGGGDTVDFQWVGGKSGNNWNLTYGLEYLNREEIMAYQRDFMDSRLDSPSPATRTPLGGLLLLDGFTGDYIDVTQNGTCDKFFGHFSIRTTGAGSRCGQFDYPSFTSVRSSDDNTSIYASGNYDLANGMQLFADVNYWKSKAKYTSGLQFWSGPSEGYFYDPNYDTLLQVQRIFQVEETGSNALGTRSTEESWSFTGGFRGALFDNKFDYEFVYGHSEYDTDVKFNRLIGSRINEYFLGESLGTDPFFDFYPAHELNLDRYTNPLTPAQFASLSATLNPRAHSEADQASMTFSGDLFELPAGSVGFASVLEFGHQEYELSPDPRTLPGADPSEAAYNYSDTGGGGERDRYALGVEFSVPIFSTLKAQLAARYDKYDDVTAVDDAVTWNAGLEWRPVDSLLLRGSYATSFRAPDMHYVFADESGFFQGVFDEYRCRLENDNDYAFCRQEQSNGDNPDYSYSPAGRRSGNKELEEETAKSWTAGFVWNITDDLSIQADYYDIEIKKGVEDLDTQYLLRKEADCLLGVDRDGNTVDTGSTQCQEFTSLVERLDAPGTTFDNEIQVFRTYPLNTAIERTKGIDASAAYRLDTDRWGDFRFELRWSHTLAYEFIQYEEDGPVADRDRDSLRNFDFRSRIASSLVWEKNDWTTGIFATRWGSLPNWAETGRIAPYTLWNVNVGKKITNKARITLFVNNVFDKLHPRDDTFDSYPYFWRAYSPVGREVFAQIEYKFN
jgi:outer membrane receptor protein involved in Fe transport